MIFGKPLSLFPTTLKGQEIILIDLPYPPQLNKAIKRSQIYPCSLHRSCRGKPILKASTSASVSSFSSATIYTARDFSGYTLQHLKAMYPNRWREAASHFGLILPELTVEQIKQTAIDQQVWDFYPTSDRLINQMLTQGLRERLSSFRYFFYLT